MEAIANIEIDLTSPRPYGPWVYAVQGDGNTRQVTVTLLSGKRPWSIPEEAEVAVQYQQPGGTKGLYNLLPDGTPAIHAQGNRVTVILAAPMLSEPGDVRTAIVINNRKLDQLTTFPFTVTVKANAFALGQKAEDYIRLQWLESKLDECMMRAKDSGLFDGAKGEPFTYDDFTPEQLAALTGPQGPAGDNTAAVAAAAAANQAAANANTAAATVTGDIKLLYQNIADLNNRKITKFYANSLGESALSDSDNGHVTDMIIYGRSVQDGTPTPENPVEIQSVVNPVVRIRGKNMLNPTVRTTTVNGITFTGHGDGTYTVAGTPTGGSALEINRLTEIGDNNYRLVGCPMGGYTTTYSHVVWFYRQDGSFIRSLFDYGNGLTFNKNSVSDAYYFKIVIQVTANTGAVNVLFRPMLVDADIYPNATYDDFEPYKENTAALSCALNAIPVTSGGNVTMDGQQYIADYVDVERGVLVRMVDASKLDDTIPIADNLDLLLTETETVPLTADEVLALQTLATYYPTTNVSITSDQLDGYTTFHYPISLAAGWNYVKQQLGDTREYIYDMDVQSALAYVNSEYAVALAELMEV